MTAAVLVFAACAVTCAVAHIAILRSIVRTAADRSGLEPGLPRPRLVAELIWAVLPILVLALVLTVTWGKVRENARVAPPPQPIIQIAR